MSRAADTKSADDADGECGPRALELERGRSARPPWLRLELFEGSGASLSKPLDECPGPMPVQEACRRNEDEVLPREEAGGLPLPHEEPAQVVPVLPGESGPPGLLASSDIF